MKDDQTDWLPICIAVGALGACALLFGLASCGFSDNARGCSGSLLIHSVSTVLQLGSFFGSIWLGYAVGTKTNKPWLGWLVFVATCFAAIGFMDFAGLPLSGRDDY